MPRHPRPLDPETGPLAVFALELRALRHRMGPTAPTIDQISAKEQIPRSTLYAAMSGARMPTEDILAALVSAWSGDATAWIIKRAAVLQEIGLQRLRDEAVSSIRMNKTLMERQRSEQLSPAEEFAYQIELGLEDMASGVRAQKVREEQGRPESLTPVEEFGRELRLMRELAGQTQRDVAERVKQKFGRTVTHSTISQFERGLRLPSWKMVEDIIRAVVYEKHLHAVVPPTRALWKRLSQDITP